MFPGRLAALDAWIPPWKAEPAPPVLAPRKQAVRGATILSAHPATTDALARLLGCDDPWSTADPEPAGAVLLDRYPETAAALEALLARA